MSKYSSHLQDFCRGYAKYSAVIVFFLFFGFPDISQAAEARFFRIGGSNRAQSAVITNTKPAFFSLSGYRQSGSVAPVAIPLKGEENNAEARLETDEEKKPQAAVKILSLHDKPPEVIELDEKDLPSTQHAIWPLPKHVESHVSSGYGYRTHPISGRRSFHDGVDIVGTPGTRVMATLEGVVEEAGRKARLGNFVRIRHDDGLISIYGHLARVNVKKDEIVRQGQTIGTLGSTGHSTGPHLHYALKKNDKSLNPMAQLARARPVKTVEVARKAD